MNNLLLLEDDIGLIDGLQYSLNKNGFHVDIARTVDEAKICLREINKYDLLILDVTLPDGTGFGVCEKVRKQNAQIPIIFLTASDEEVNVIRGLDCGGATILLSGSNIVSDAGSSGVYGLSNRPRRNFPCPTIQLYILVVL